MDKIVKTIEHKDRFETTFDVTFEQENGTQYTTQFMPESKYRFEVLKRKLVKQYNLPLEVIKELEGKVEDLQHYYYNEGLADGNLDPDL
jgi:hypothetical protein